MKIFANIVEWLLDRLPVVIFVVIFIVQVVRSMMRTRQEEQPADKAKPNVLEEERRIKEIQEQVRRRIAERRGDAPPAEPPPIVRRETAPAPVPSPETTQMPEPFGGPLRRVLEEIERQTKPEPTPPPLPPRTVMVENRAAEWERQQELAEEMRAIEEARAAAKRRQARAAEAWAGEIGSEAKVQTAGDTPVLGDWRNPQDLRRAVVLREVLGTPVGLR
ncbi:MAG: hypothetical protein FJ399_13705 [Verrucomicrobia bacterium]|nr:hypothetical protein [Verrucomicrobiota bacterium]